MTSAPLRIWGSPPAAGGDALARGADLVLNAAPAASAPLPEGVLLDDWLSVEDRRAIDERAQRRLAAWRAEHDEALTVAGASLAWLHEGELLVDVFLREQRTLDGARAALASLRPERAELRRVDLELEAALTAMLEEASVVLASTSDPVEPPAYPIAFARAAGRRGVKGALREAAGVPRRVRGSVLVRPAWTLAPLWRELGTDGATLPVLDPAALPSLGARAVARTAARGGWIGHPGSRLRARSRSAAAAAADALGETGDDALARLVDRRASRFLRTRARDTGALLETARRAFAAGLRAAVVPSDGTAEARALAHAAAEHGGAIVHVQHGFFSDLWRVDGRLGSHVDGLTATHAAVWSERDAERMRGHAPGRVEVTGNPGARVPERGRAAAALVLVQPPSAGSALFDPSSSFRHAGAAVRAVRSTGAFRDLILRPHPLDQADYRGIRAAVDDLHVRLDRTSPIEALIADAAVVIGTLSTATLQAAAAGVPTVFLDTIGAPLPWPLDGSGDLPVARDSESLAETLGALGGLASGEDEARAALGVRDDATAAVASLVRDAVGG